jgi:hypothetical protein
VTVQLCFIGMAYLIIRVKDYGKWEVSKNQALLTAWLILWP